MLHTSHIIGAAHRAAGEYGVAAPSTAMTAVSVDALQSVAHAYHALPAFDDRAVPAWEALARETEAQWLAMERAGFIFERRDSDPYANPAELFADVARGRISVLSTESTGGHPYWDDRTNDVFRAVHDVMGHAATGRGFDRHGEARAFDHHATTYSPLARMALATELRGQSACVAVDGGRFPAQKVAILPEYIRTMNLRSSELRDRLDALVRHRDGGLQYTVA